MSTPLIVCNAITAEVIKDEGVFDYSFGLVWESDNQHAINFVKEIEKKFRRKTKTYGFLSVDSARNSIPTILSTFVSSTEDCFNSTTDRLMDKLNDSLNEDGRGNASVGHMVFIHYKNQSEEDDLGRLLVVMVDKKDVFDFSENLTPTQFKSIDVDTLRQAVLYDLTLFDALYPDNPSDNKEQAYLMFISGRSKGQFFQEALGVRNMVENSVSVSSIFDAIEKYAESLELRSAHIRSLQDHVETLIKNKNGKQISLNSVARIVNSNLPDKCSDQSSDDFVNFVNQNQYQISEVFDVTRGQLEKATSIVGNNGSDCSYRIKKSALGSMSEKSKSIKYDTEKRLLYIEIKDESQHQELASVIIEREDSDA